MSPLGKVVDTSCGQSIQDFQFQSSHDPIIIDQRIARAGYLAWFPCL